MKMKRVTVYVDLAQFKLLELANVSVNSVVQNTIQSVLEDEITNMRDHLLKCIDTRAGDLAELAQQLRRL